MVAGGLPPLGLPGAPGLRAGSPGQVRSPTGLPCLMTLLLCNQNPPFSPNPAEQESPQETMVFKHLSVPGKEGDPASKPQSRRIQWEGEITQPITTESP